MKVDESETRKELARQRTSSSSTEITEEQLHTAIFRILDASWKQSLDNFTYLPETAETIQQDQSLTIQDLISQSLMEMIILIANGLIPHKILQDTNSSADNTSLSSTSPTHSPINSPVGNCPAPLLPFVSQNSNQPEIATYPRLIAINYLADVFARVGIEERNQPKKSNVPPMSDTLYELRVQSIQYTALVLQGGNLFEEGEFDKKTDSLLLPALLHQSLPNGKYSTLILRFSLNNFVSSRIYG